MKPLSVAVGVVVVTSFSGLVFASAEGNDNADLARVEALAKQTGVSEARILDEIMGRMGRIESTTSDIRSLLEAMPDANAAPVATAVTTPAVKPAVCPSPPHTSDQTSEEIEDSTQFPVSLVAGGSALLALLIGLGIGRRRATTPSGGTKPLSNVPSRSGPDSVPEVTQEITNTHTPGGEPVWRPNHEARTNSVSATFSRTLPPSVASPDSLAESPAPSLPTSPPTPDASAQKPIQSGAMARSLPVTVPPVGGDDAFDPTLELAEIMLSMGLGSGAAQALEEHIRENPKEALIHWLKLLDVYRKDGHRTDFENAARELRKNFNIQASDWLALGGRGPSLEDFSRVIEQINALWNEPAECVSFMSNLLEDNRDGSRNGFPQPVAEEILMLIAIQRVKHPEIAPAKPGQTSANPSPETA